MVTRKSWKRDLSSIYDIVEHADEMLRIATEEVLDDGGLIHEDVKEKWEITHALLRQVQRNLTDLMEDDILVDGFARD